ncbi:MAG TPA: hypothetical protein VHZ99_11335 [Steroidobacteraceae bacterium]|nr:hypothetical protein [Steroidobacteraceae bacterium]
MAILAHPKLLEHVPLQWRATSDLRLGAAPLAKTSVTFESFQDVRDNRQSIGENEEDEQPLPVTTDDDVGAFVSTHMRELFDKAGLDTVSHDGAVTIRGEIKRFYVRETSTYQAEVIVHVTVLDQDGQKLWSGDATGDAKRFGRSYNLENYYEVLSDAIVNATSSMLQSEEFERALAGHGRPAVTAPG